MDTSEDLVGFVNQTEIERRGPTQAFEARVAADVFAPGKENAGGSDIDGGVRCLGSFDPEQRVKLMLPLPEQRARHYDEDSRGTFR